MSLFSKLFKKKTTEVVFEKVEPIENATLETQNGLISNFSESDIDSCLQEMYEDVDQFVTLTLEQARYGIRYVQACQVDNGITVQLGIEKDENTRLVEKVCSEEECRAIFHQFYSYGNVNDLESYKPVEFF